MFTIGICDDEVGTCEELSSMLCEYGKKNGIKVEISIWYTGEGLCKFLTENNQLDLLFLDIELISTDGIKVGNFIRTELENIETAIVYISSKSNYAMSLFRIKPLDFLIKPLKREEIEEVVGRSLQEYESKNQVFECYTKGTSYKILYKEILYFYSQNKKINIVLKNEEIQFRGKMKDIVQIVPHNFILIHQSCLINQDYVAECTYDTVKMRNAKEVLLSISQPYRKFVREQIVQSKWER